MPSGITHLLLAKELANRLGNENKHLNDIIAGRFNYFLIGSIAPDLPYTSALDNDIFSSNTKLADKFHYENTSAVPIEYLNYIKEKSSKFENDDIFSHCAFVWGYIAHIIADGIMLPFVRDKVGNYNENKKAHRVLEMHIDVIFNDHLTKQTGKSVHFRHADLHEELKDFLGESKYKEILQMFCLMIKKTYKEDIEYNDFADWINALYRAFDVAQSDYLHFYRNIDIFDGVIYKSNNDLINNKDELLTLNKTIEGYPNFLGTDSVHFIDDCVPKFYEVFIPILYKAYDFIFNNRTEFDLNILPDINLDTGRSTEFAEVLTEKPIYWS